MKQKIAFIIVCCLLCVASSFGQKEKMTREEKDEKNQARTARINSKNDYAIFHRQMLGLKEYLDERKKIPALQKASKGPVKVVAAVDSLDEEDDAKNKVLTGYIRQDVGDNSINIYEVIFDRSQKKIVDVKRTQEGMDADKELPEDRAEKTTKEKTKEKTVHKKNKDEDEEEDNADEDKPANKTKHKQKDKENDDD
jgi:hypothetical protein